MTFSHIFCRWVGGFNHQPGDVFALNFLGIGSVTIDALGCLDQHKKTKGWSESQAVGSPVGSYRTFHSWWSLSKISPTYPWKIPRTFHQQFMKEFLSLWGFGEVWGIFPGYVGKVNEFGIEFLPQVCGLSSGWLFVYICLLF